jgi:hypothetical protein
MNEQIRFYFDEHIPIAIARELRRQGIDVLTVQDAGRIGLPDLEQLIFAAQQNRVMVTMDSDFILLAARGIPHAGIAFARPGSRSIGDLVQGLILIYQVLNPDQMRNQIEYL